MSTCSARHVAEQRALREHGLDVQPVAARADQQEQRVQPGRADAPASSSRRSSARPSVVSSMLSSRTSVCTSVSPADHLGEAGGQRGRLLEVRQVGRVARSVVPERRPVGELLGDGSQRRARPAAGSAPRRRAPACRGSGVELVGAATGRRGARASTYSSPSTTQSSRRCSRAAAAPATPPGSAASLRASSR